MPSPLDRLGWIDRSSRPAPPNAPACQQTALAGQSEIDWIAMPTLRIETCLPHPNLHPNSRCHWAAKAREVKQARYRAYSAAMIALAQAGIGKYAPLWKRASIKAVFYVKDRRGLSADQDGRVASVKAHCDGIADAGVVENDRGLVWLSPPVEHIIDRSAPRLVLEVTELV